MAMQEAGRQRKTRFSLSNSAMCDLAFEGVHNDSTLAKIYGITARSVPRIINLVAHVGLLKQQHQLQTLVDIFTEHAPDWVVASFMWDETPQRIAVPMKQTSTRGSQTSTWQVLVSRCQLLWQHRGRALIRAHDVLCDPARIANHRVDCTDHWASMLSERTVWAMIVAMGMVSPKGVGPGWAPHGSSKCAPRERQLPQQAMFGHRVMPGTSRRESDEERAGQASHHLHNSGLIARRPLK